MTATRHANLGLDVPTLEPDDDLIVRLAALATASQAAPRPFGVPPWRVALATAGLVGISVGGAWATGSISVPGLPDQGTQRHERRAPSTPPTPEEPGTPRSGSSGSPSHPASAPTSETPGPAEHDATTVSPDEASDSAGPGPAPDHDQGDNEQGLHGQAPTDPPGLDPSPPAGQGSGQGQRPDENSGQGQAPEENPGQGQAPNENPGQGQAPDDNPGLGLGPGDNPGLGLGHQHEHRQSQRRLEDGSG